MKDVPMLNYFGNRDTDPQFIEKHHLTQAGFKEDEIAHILNSGRCDKCGHLHAFHNEHCCLYCMLPDCECRD